MRVPFVLSLRVLVPALLLTACGGGGASSSAGESEPVVSGETRPQDARSFTVAALDSTAVYPDYQPGSGGVPSFTAVPGFEGSSRWGGELNGAAYRIEVPSNWNGELVMYTHGYHGTGAVLTVETPSIRHHLLQLGYAWAASSYSRNYYDVRAGIEDTNALALAFNSIAAAKGRALATPSKIFIIGHSMGGHIAAAAVEAETVAQARHRVVYAGAVPMCGVTGDMALWDTFAAMQIGAQAVAGFASRPLPNPNWSSISPQVNAALWSSFPSPATPTASATPTVLGEHYVSILKHLTGGERPLFRLGLAAPGSSLALAFGVFGDDGTIGGILNKWGTDTTRFSYTVEGNPAVSAAISGRVQRVSAEPQANARRSDGLRWMPRVNGEVQAPVVAIHTLGDLTVPFSMMQIYRQRADAKGNGDRLVTRAIRGIHHCDFTVAEQNEAFDAMVQWVRTGVKPSGDDVVTPSVVAAPHFGCTFSRAPVAGVDADSTIALRGLVTASGATCP
ncbi:alpha/beta hydrolase [Piscinibacter sp. HJYY11]|uniref:alpha/beta hydrolase n=1 Tax=Piscinibacter sp. HJYY11 TaxID=2801333 RepID=UPI00191CD862|nr:alpha/beta hydrolase [Piscinibacter sp. HJYY11]MBL0726104.1 alpha/beta hydrolase [Piscinibacter sp. HJYY11]